MEQKDIDIYEILKDVECGTELYTPMCGKVDLRYLQDNKEADEAIITNTNNGEEYTFNKNGKYVEEGEVLLFPSNEMRDWSKFFKKGDVLVSNDSDSHIIFNCFSKNDYTTFEGKHWISVSKKRHVSCLKMRDVQDYHIEDNKDSAQTYINTIEKFLGGKLNRETLEIEKPQPAFKTFDKVLVRCGKGFKWLPAFFVRDRGEDFASRYNVLPLHSGKAADFTQCIPYEGHENFAFTDYDFVDLPF